MTAVDAARGPAQAWAEAGLSVRLAAPRSQMAKLLRVTGLDRHFTICATLDDALPV